MKKQNRTQKNRRIKKNHVHLISSTRKHTQNKTGKHIKHKHTRKPASYFKVSVEHFEKLNVLGKHELP